MKDNKTLFDSIKHTDEFGNEYWFARELQKVLDYTQWRRFESVINKAKESCNNSSNGINNHFANVGKMVNTGDSTRKIIDYRLSRYACYLIAQNGDPRKAVIARAQTYFAIQTRKQELSEIEYSLLTEDGKRLYQRTLTKRGNYFLNKVAASIGVKNFDRFHNEDIKDYIMVKLQMI